MTLPMNNATKLREYKRLYGLNSQKVAIILGAKLKTVNSWLLSPDSPSYRPMPDYRLDHLKLKLRNRKKVKL